MQQQSELLAAALALYKGDLLPNLYDDWVLSLREQLCFYMSTLAYRVVVALHGREETAQQLSQLARDGPWTEMPGLLGDEMLDAFAIRGKWSQLPGIVKARYGDGLLDRINYYLPFVPGQEDEGWRATIAGFRRK